MNQQTEINIEAFILYCYIWLFEECGPDFNDGGFGVRVGGFFDIYGGFIFIAVIKYFLKFWRRIGNGMAFNMPLKAENLQQTVQLLCI